MLTSDEILLNFVSNLRLASDKEDAEYLAKYDQFKYISDGFINKPEFADLTKSMLENIIKGNPGLYFELKLDEKLDFVDYEKRAAQMLAITNPLTAVLYKIFEKPYFQTNTHEAKALQESLLFRLNYVLGGSSKRPSLKILKHPSLKDAMYEILSAIKLHNKELYNKLPTGFHKFIEK